MFDVLTVSGFRARSIFAVVLLCAMALSPQISRAQDTAIYISIRDTFAYAGQEIHLPVVVTNVRDTIDGYQVQYQTDRPNMISFQDTLAIDSMIICANPPSCTVLDTVIDTLLRTPVDRQGTLSGPWEYIAGRTTGVPSIVRITAISDMTGDNKPKGIPPGTSNATLIKLVAYVYCPPDRFGGGEVQLVPTYLNFDFSDPLGQLITPVSKRIGRIRILDPVPGDLDYSGTADVLDVVKLIGCAFENKCPDCSSIRTDFNCDQVTDVMDLIFLIEYVFNGGPPSGCR